MKNNKTCFLDMDGVLVDFIGGVLRAFNIKDNPYDDITNYGKKIINALNISSKKFYNALDYNFWKDLNWTKEGKNILELIEKYFGKSNICLLTAPTRNIGCIPGKLKWVEENLPEYKNQILIGKAKYFCAAPNKILIDDNRENIQDFINYGGNGILVDRPWDEYYSYKNTYDSILISIEKKINNILNTIEDRNKRLSGTLKGITYGLI